MKLTSLLLLATLLFSGITAPADELTTALGGLGAQAVFCQYFAIGELADLYGAKTYDKDKAAQLASAFGKLSENAQKGLKDLIGSGKLNPSDTGSAQELLDINKLLGQMAEGVKAYIDDPSKAKEATYNEAREEAWKRISKFMGLE